MEELGKYIWVNDVEHEWLLGKIIGIVRYKYKVEVRIGENKFENRLIEKSSNYIEVYPSCLRAVDDLLFLGDFNKQTLLYNTRERFAQDFIYSFIGSPILIAVNPNKNLPIYDDKHIWYYKDYFSRLVKNMQIPDSANPHIYHIAEAAYQDMIIDRKNQSILITGESGSGKTESTKIILKYLAISSMYSADKNISNDNSSIEKQILDSTPILEAFGNAKTIRNNNSSRFGKFIQINFTDNGKIVSAKIFHYLLDKNRIVKLQKGERNFHIFYQVLKGADPHEQKKFHIGPNISAEYFYYLNQSECIEIENEKENFLATKECLSKLGFKSTDINYIFNIIIGILYLGNIKFFEIISNGFSCAEVDPNVHDFKIAAELLGIEPDVLRQLLTIQKIKDNINGTVTERNMSLKSAYNIRDAIAKQLYSKMFNWIVKRINEAISNNAMDNDLPNSSKKIRSRKNSLYKINLTQTRYIGLLDIFGYENLKTNSFEQFCINYANERVQQFFNNHIFKLEQEEYQNEKIKWTNIDFIDNLEIINLIDDNKMSILSLLDSEGLVDNCDDLTFRNKVYQNLLGKNKYLENADDGFLLIHHYAGDVYYNVEDFIRKNLDVVSNDIQETMEQSKHKLVNRLFSVNSDKFSINQLQSDTLSKQFKKQLDDLLRMLSQSNPRYVKCIKPNSDNKPQLFDSFFVGDQLLSEGVLEAIKVRKQGFAIRKSHSKFCKRYAQLTPDVKLKDYEINPSNINSITQNIKVKFEDGYKKIAYDFQKMCSDILNNLIESEDFSKLLNTNLLNDNLYQIGVTNIYMKEEITNVLEFKLNKIKVTYKIQTYFRRYMMLKKISLIRYATKTVAKIFRGFIRRKQFKKEIKIIKIQRFIRFYKSKHVILQNLKKLASDIKKIGMRSKSSKILDTEIKNSIKSKDNININSSNYNSVDDTNISKISNNLNDSKNNKNLIDSSRTDYTNIWNNILDDINITSSGGKKGRKKQSKLKELTTIDMSSVLDSELSLRIQLLNDQMKKLLIEKNTINESLINYKYLNEAKDKQLEILEGKLDQMKDNVMKYQNEINQMKLNSTIKMSGDDLTYIELDKLRDEVFQLKRMLNDKETQLEILNLNLTELTKTNLDLSKLNDNLKEQISRRRDKDEGEISRLLESLNQLEKEKSDLERKLKEGVDITYVNSNLNSSFLSNYTTGYMDKDFSDYRRQISHLKNENKNLNKKLEELRTQLEIEVARFKSEISDKDVKVNEILRDLHKSKHDLEFSQKENKELSDLNRKIKEISRDLQIKLNHFEKNTENVIEISQVKYEFETIIKRKENEIKELMDKNEDNSQLIDRLKKMEEALRNELKLKEMEISKRNEIIKEIQEEMEKLTDENIVFKKDNFNLKAKLDMKENEILNKYENAIKNKSQEITILKEKVTKYEKFIIEMKEILLKKQLLLDNKKKINMLLVDIVKLKRGEVQLLEALKFTSNTNLKDSLNKIRENEKVLLAKVDEITNNSDYTDESEDDDVESDVASND